MMYNCGFMPLLTHHFLSAPWCGHCVQFAPIFEQLAQLLEGQVRLAKLDCDRFGHICQMVGIQAFPSVMLYPGEHSLIDWRRVIRVLL